MTRSPAGQPRAEPLTDTRPPAFTVAGATWIEPAAITASAVTALTITSARAYPRVLIALSR